MKKLEDYVLMDKKKNDCERDMLVLLEKIVHDFDDFYYSNVDYVNLIHFGRMLVIKKIWAIFSSLGVSTGSYFASLKLLENDFKIMPFVLGTVFTSSLGYFLLQRINNDEVLTVDPNFVIDNCKIVSENYISLINEFFSKYVDYTLGNCVDFVNVDDEIEYLFTKHKGFIDAKIEDGTFSEDFSFDNFMDIYYDCKFDSFNDFVNGNTKNVKILKKNT